MRSSYYSLALHARSIQLKQIGSRSVSMALSWFGLPMFALIAIWRFMEIGLYPQ
jgi:hypothetical protein